MGLATPERIRTLQRKLYVKAKGEPDFRFFTKTGYITQTMGVTINGGQDNPLSTVVMP